ncbi:MAG: Crp/Fnr family transcriptional regulator [Spirochaetia bacterium]|jgi:CRP-like cAMP-binding protein|nr:Crp/Fnr family transcriptional regulator [Spirochaetia bacterium]
MNLNLAAFERFAVIFQPGDLIFSEFEPGDSFYLIQSGRVQISKVMGDIEKTIDILYPGEIFGEMAILEEAPRSANAVALDQVKALEFNRANFEILMRGNPQIALKLLKLFTKRIYDQRRRFMILTLDDIQARVLDVFLMLSETDSNPSENTEGREFKTTIDDIAHWAGLATEKCREVINHFASQNRIEVYPDKMVVKNLNEFSRFVNSRRRAAE